MGMEDKPRQRGRGARPRGRPSAATGADGATLHGGRRRPHRERAQGGPRYDQRRCVRLAVGGVFLSSRFDSARRKRARRRWSAAAPSQRCVCGRSEGGDYVKCAGGAPGAAMASCTAAASD